MNNGDIVVSLFCGGRGSATIIRELIRHPNITLHLLVNAYDDGLSTGKLRQFIPGMLGPSDFRKNLSYLLDFFSTNQYMLEEFLEYRFPLGFEQTDFEGLRTFVHNPADYGVLHPDLQRLFQALDDGLWDHLLGYLRLFFDHHARQEQSFDFRDCSLGNLLFAGAYLKHQHDFNGATRELATLFKSQANLINITRGENRVLVALKGDGEVLVREEQIVGSQSSVRILDLFLLKDALSETQKADLASLSLGEQRDYLRKLDFRPLISSPAREALLESDIIVFGPGTQFSSLFPSYMTVGVSEAITNSPAKVKAFVVNLAHDHDIQNLDVTDLVDKALNLFGDADNHTGLITHILYHEESQHLDNSVRLDADKLSPTGRYKNALVVPGNFANPVHPQVHSGYATVHNLLDIHHRTIAGVSYDTVDIYIDLHKRSLARKLLLQEFLELDWQRHFSKVRLCLNGVNLSETTLQHFVEVVTTSRTGLFSEVDAFLDWLNAGDSQFLVTLTGDGEYRLKDILFAIDVLKSTSFGAAYGSRSQSRQQFLKSFKAAYGESRFVYWFSRIGALVISFLFALRHNVTFSDPLTGFRVYSRSRLGEPVRQTLAAKRPATAAGITKTLVKNAVEIAEVPVLYRTFQGFTDVKWRFRRGLKNAWGLLW